jgi:hypothetical protein
MDEGLKLRVQDPDFEQSQILVRHGKGGNDRRTMLPRSLQPDLRAHLARVKELHERELARGRGAVLLPYAMDRKAPGRARNGCGSGSSRRPASRRTRGRAGAAGITPIRAR